jgi:nitroreductase
MPSPITPTHALEALRWRYATKVFDSSRKLTPEEVSTLEQGLVLTPSSFGIQPWRFLVISSPELRQRLRPHAWNQSQVTDASHLYVLCARTSVTPADVDRLMERTASLRDVPVETLQGYKGLIEGFVKGMSLEAQLAWNQRQVYIALGQLMTTAAFLGLDTCPIEGFEPEAVDEILGLRALGLTATVLCAVGHRSPEDRYGRLPKVRYSPAEVIDHRDE